MCMWGAIFACMWSCVCEGLHMLMVGVLFNSSRWFSGAGSLTDSASAASWLAQRACGDVSAGRLSPFRSHDYSLLTFHSPFFLTFLITSCMISTKRGEGEEEGRGEGRVREGGRETGNMLLSFQRPPPCPLDQGISPGPCSFSHAAQPICP